MLKVVNILEYALRFLLFFYNFKYKIKKYKCGENFYSNFKNLLICNKWLQTFNEKFCHWKALKALSTGRIFTECLAENVKKCTSFFHHIKIIMVNVFKMRSICYYKLLILSYVRINDRKELISFYPCDTFYSTKIPFKLFSSEKII